jgi:hypothetical protein
MRATVLLSALLLAACGSSDEGGNNSSEPAGQTIEQTPSNLQDDPNNSVVPLTTPTTAAAPSPTPVAGLPEAFHGRWGMVANDCVPGRADPKGLMIVAADGLGFYESRGSVKQARQLRADTLELDLAFTGEGQEWDRTETLTLADDGRTLIREEQRPAASYRYSKCPAGKEGPVSPTGA